MSKTFFPRASVFVEASRPHPLNTQYKVSIGNEDWDGVFVDVAKTQMVYNGVVSGRRAPSFPVNTDDHRIVNEVIERLMAGESADAVQRWVEERQR